METWERVFKDPMPGDGERFVYENGLWLPELEAPSLAVPLLPRNSGGRLGNVDDYAHLRSHGVLAVSAVVVPDENQYQKQLARRTEKVGHSVHEYHEENTGSDITAKFELLRTFRIIVPYDYVHVTQLKSFRKKYGKSLCYFNNNITDANFTRFRLISSQGKRSWSACTVRWCQERPPRRSA